MVLTIQLKMVGEDVHRFEMSVSSGQDIAPLPYSAFSSRQKRWAVFLVAFAAWFSTLSSFIYFTAIPLLALGLHTSIERINFTLTSYLAVSALAPCIVGNLADFVGRKPIILTTLGVYILSNVALAIQRSFAALLVLRMLQSAGISGISASFIF